MSTSDSLTAALLEQVSGRFEPWMSCDESFERSDGVLGDLLDRGLPLPEAFAAHLAGCGACRDEFETLVELVAADWGLDAAAARAKLDAQLP